MITATMRAETRSCW